MTASQRTGPHASDHNHHYYQFHPRNFANEYHVYAVPKNHKPAIHIPSTHARDATIRILGATKDPVDYSLSQVSRDEALKAARWTGDLLTDSNIKVFGCPHCDTDALSQAAKQPGTIRDRVRHQRPIMDARVTSIPKEERS
jgi:hypothetical protein